MGDYRKLEVYEASHRLAVELYHATMAIKRGIRGDIGDQLRRASVSVPANIVEGCGRLSDGDMLRHFRIALGSASEVEYFLTYARDTGMMHKLPAEELVAKAASVRRMLAGLIRRIDPDVGYQKENRRAAEGSRGVSEFRAEDQEPRAESRGPAVD